MPKSNNATSEKEGWKMDLKGIAHFVAKDCGYLQELQMLESLYLRKDYKEFLDLLRVNGGFSLWEVEILKSFSLFFNKNRDFFMQWLENESYEIGCESVLDFLERELKLTFADFLENKSKEVKKRVLQSFVYSASVKLCDYFRENETLREFL